MRGESNMKKEILWIALVVVAAAVKIFNIPSNWEVGWTVAPGLRRGEPMSTVIFFALLAIVTIWVLVDLALRWRAGMLL